MIASTSQSRLRACLRGVDFPASTNELIEAAKRKATITTRFRCCRDWHQ
ncbi:DUF2795 domain-containing protein [Mycobacterium avium subsp. paratuberculosis]